MKILVTGGAGYIGQILCEHLISAGHDVTVLDNLMYGQSGPFHLCRYPGLAFVKGDCRDESTLRPLVKAADIIIPLAAIVGQKACDISKTAARSTNHNAVSLLNRLRSRSSQLLIYPCTNSGYGSTDNLCTEDTPLKPISLYGRTKVEAEAELLSTPNVISLRLATVFGASPRMRWDLLVNHFVYEALSSKYIVVFEKDYKRNYVHVQDVAACFVHCIDQSVSMVGSAYNLGLDSANLSKEDLAFLVKNHVPSCYVDFAEVGKDPDQRNYTVSNEKLRQAGFEAVQGLDPGIEELMTAYRMT